MLQRLDPVAQLLHLARDFGGSGGGAPAGAAPAGAAPVGAALSGAAPRSPGKGLNMVAARWNRAMFCRAMSSNGPTGKKRPNVPSI